MKNLLTILVTIALLLLQTSAQEIKNVQENENSKSKSHDSVTNVQETATGTESAATNSDINTTKSLYTTEAPVAKSETITTTTKTTTTLLVNDVTTSTVAPPPPTTSTPITATTTTTTSADVATYNATATPQIIPPFEPYCSPSLCELFNGTHIHHVPHVACKNRGNFDSVCGSQPHLLYMSERRRNLILDLHNLARSRIASGQVVGYKSASHMPQLKWDSELEYLAALHVKRCQFAHDLCRNTPRFEFSGQNIGYFWIRRDIRSHSRRMKNFIVNWFKEYVDANQTFIDSYYPHPGGKKIGHFTLLVADRVHRVGCAAIRFHQPGQLQDTKFLMTCNYDFNNLFGEPIYQSGPTASKCSYKISGKYPALCDWKDAVYDYDSEESIEDSNLLDSNISTV